MVKKKSLTLKLRFFLVYTGIFARIYDSAASSASPRGSAASLAIKEINAKKVLKFQNEGNKR